MGIGFVHPALLSGLGLVALPIIIHWLSRRRFRRVDWGAMQFLLLAEKENRRRLRFEQWLLVALRCLALALLALVVARPYLEPALAAQLLGGREDVRRVLLIDDSASLAHTRAGAADFEQVREAAQSMLRWIAAEQGAGGDVTVLRTSDPSEALHRGALTATSLAELQERLARVRPRPWSAAPRVACAEIARLLEARPDEAAHVYVFSDFQRSDWVGGANEVVEPFLPLEELQRDNLKLSLVRLPTGVRENIAIERVWLERPHTIAGLPAVLRVLVANHTLRPLRGVELQVAAGEIATVPLEIPELAAGAREVAFTELLLSDPGAIVLEARLPADDALAWDNARRITAQVRPALRVLLVDGAPAAEAAASEVFFARSALTPAGPAGSGIAVEVLLPEAVEGAPLERFDCIVLGNVPAPTPGLVSLLREYVEQGGGLAIFLGDQVRDPARYSAAFAAGGESLLPRPLGPRVVHATAAERVGLRSVEPHPVTALLATQGEAATDYVRFASYWELADAAAPGGAGATVLAAFADERSTPALVAKRLGAGRVLLFASTLDADWHNWPRAIDGSYVVTLLELVQHLARRARNADAFAAGAEPAWWVNPEAYEAEAIVRRPRQAGGSAVEGVFTRDEAGRAALRFELPRATELGVYALELSTRAGETEVAPLAVNMPAAESDLAVAERRTLEELGAALRAEVVEIGAGLSPGQTEARQELWPLLLAVLVAVLLGEQALACWFGMPRARRGRFADPRQWLLGRRAA